MIILVTLVGAGLGPIAVMYLWAAYGPSSSSDVSFAKLANVPRRHLERRGDWQKRCSAACDARDRASEAFIAAARWEERGPRAGVWLLAASHPASLAYLAAQYPDGPPLDKLRDIAHGVQNPEYERGVPLTQKVKAVQIPMPAGAQPHRHSHGSLWRWYQRLKSWAMWRWQNRGLPK